MSLNKCKLLLGVILIPFVVTGCSSGGLNNRYQEDRSNQMAALQVTEESYAFTLTQSLSSISSQHYNLINQLNSIKNNYSDSFAKQQALNSVSSLKSTIQEKRTLIDGLNEPSSKTASKSLLIKGLDAYTSELSNLEVKLGGNSNTIQASMDSLSLALENIKQHQF